MGLFHLSSTLDPRDGYVSTDDDWICTLAKKFYPEDFSMTDLQYELKHYMPGITCCPSFQNFSTPIKIHMSEQWQRLAIT